jgi:uncharacterized protein (UPF0297 family)
MNDKTSIFSLKDLRNGLLLNTLDEVIESLEKNGYNATSQIVGYLTTGDLTYITSHDRSRQKIKKYDRVEILAALLKYYRGE